MESANFHHLHQLQEQFAEYFNSANPSGFKASITNEWNPSIVLNDSNYNSYLSESVPNSRDLWPKYSVDEPILRSSVRQDLSFCEAKTTQQSANEELHLAKFKDEMPAVGTFPKLSEIICYFSNVEASHLLTPKHEQQCSSDLLEDLCLGNFSAGVHIAGQQPNSARDLYSINTQNSESFGGVAGSSRSYNFSHVFPSFSPSYSSSSLVSKSLGLNLQTLDLLTSTNNSGNFSQPSHDILGVRKGSVSLSPDHMHELADSPSNRSNKITAFMNEVTRAKRPSRSSDHQPKESNAEIKKSRSVSRCSCPPLKVRKEKLGDRIAALQKLVAPFGKTDTASVLTEAIGYIQFLHDRVQTLSMPYMRSSRSKPIIRAAMQPGLSKEGGYGTDQAKPDLRSRGLCLLPKSCASYITGYNDHDL